MIILLISPKKASRKLKISNFDVILNKNFRNRRIIGQTEHVYTKQTYHPIINAYSPRASAILFPSCGVDGPSQVQRKIITLQYLVQMAKRERKQETKRGLSNQSCTICMVRVVNCKTVECSHEFCYRCLSKWTRRKGTCPLCRQDVRRVLYKNRVVEPDFLKVFDEEKIVLTESNQINPIRSPNTSRITIRPYLLVLPSIQNLSYVHTINYFSFSYGFSLQ